MVMIGNCLVIVGLEFANTSPKVQLAQAGQHVRRPGNMPARQLARSLPRILLQPHIYQQPGTEE
jgi:hypothetical protein